MDPEFADDQGESNRKGQQIRDGGGGPDPARPKERPQQEKEQGDIEDELAQCGEEEGREALADCLERK